MIRSEADSSDESVGQHQKTRAPNTANCSPLNNKRFNRIKQKENRVNPVQSESMSLDSDVFSS